MIKELLKNVKVMHSLSAYYKHGYKQWGTIAKNIIRLDDISTPFALYCIKASEIDETIKEIEKIAKGNEKAVYAFVRKLSWQLDDAKNLMTQLSHAVHDTGVIERYKGHECIDGQGKRLGLNILMIRTFKAVKEIESITKKLEGVANKGVDIMDIHQHVKNAI